MSKAAFFSYSRKKKKPWWVWTGQAVLIFFFLIVFSVTLYHAFHTRLFELIMQALILDPKFLFFLLLNVFIICGAALTLIYQWVEKDNIRFRAKQRAYRSELVSPDYYKSIRRMKIDHVIPDVTMDSERKIAIDHDMKDSDLVTVDDTVIVKKARQTYISFKDGNLDGVFKTYFNNGNLLAEISYKEGKLHGRCVVYYPNGLLHNEKHFNEGRLHGIFRAWDEDGALFFEIQYADDMQHGFDKIYRKNGIIEYEDIYVKGRLVARRSFDDGGHFKYLQKYQVE